MISSSPLGVKDGGGSGVQKMKEMRTSRVRQLRFSVLTDKVLKKLSVTRRAMLFDPQQQLLPEGLTVEVASAQKTYGSVVDPRMGSDHVGHTCETCHKKMDPGDHFDCPGHFGHIELACPQIWPLFSSELTHVLENVCPFCSRRVAKIHIRKDKHTTRSSACDDEDNLFEDEAEDDVMMDDDLPGEDENEDEEAVAEDEEALLSDEEDVVVGEDEIEEEDVIIADDEDVVGEDELIEDEVNVEDFNDDAEDSESESESVVADSDDDRAVPVQQQQAPVAGSKHFKCSCFAAQGVRFKYYIRKNPEDSGLHLEVRISAKRVTTTGRVGRSDVTTRFIVPNQVIVRILSQITPQDWRYMYHEKYREYRNSASGGTKAVPPYRPTDLMISNVPILPTVDRPSKVVVDCKKQADLITRQYNQIVARNNWLKHHMNKAPALGEKPSRKKKATSESPESDIDPTGRTLVQHLSGLYGIDPHLTAFCQELLTLEGVPVGRLATRTNLDTFRGERSLASAVAAVVDKTNKPGVTSRNLAQRFQGKEGRLRGNLAGKRVDFSARTVITPGTDLDIDEIGIPYSFARSLTVPVLVTDFNLEKMREKVRSGDVRLLEKGKTRIWCDEKMKPEVLERNARDLAVGSTVHRYLQDGDIVIMNRQPTLHKPSMQGHRVKIFKKQQDNVRYAFGGVVNKRPPTDAKEANGARRACMNGFETRADDLTLRLNLSVTRPYNADFDGDEMNLHVPQTLEAQAEVRELMSVNHQLGSRFIGIVQDTLIGAYLMSASDTFLTEEFASWVWMSASGRRPDLPPLPPPAILKPKRMWTGRQLLNLVFHEVNLSFNPDTDLFSGKDADLVMVNGEIVAGQIRKPHFGEGGYVFSTVYINYGFKKAAGVINNFQAIVNPYVLRRGVSVGIRDCMPSEDVRARLEAWRSSIPERANAVDPTDEAAVQAFTRQLKSEVSTIVVEGAKKSRNRIRDLSNAGSKGSDNNLVQIMGGLSQQIVMGHRPFANETRVFPTDPFEESEHNLASRGFVKNSLLDGITPTEYFCHAAGGREGIIDTGIKTAEAGYATRKMACVTEGSVRNYKGGIDNQALLKSVLTAPLYGDGMDVSMILKHQIDVHTRSDEDLRQLARVIRDKSLELKLFTRLKQDRAAVQAVCLARQDPGIDFWLPVDFRHIVTNTDVLPGPPLDTVSIMQKLVNNLDVFVVYHPNTNDFARDLNRRATELFRISLRTFMLKLLTKTIPTKTTFESWMEQILDRFNRSQVQAGEPVGLIATQSLMQTTMQATLNTFHTAGTGAGAAATGGLKYFNALISAQSPKVATTFISLKDPSFEWSVLDAVAPEVKMASLVSQVRELSGTLPNTRVRRLHPIETIAVDFILPAETLFKKRVTTIQVFEAVGKLVGHCFLELVTGGLRMYVHKSMYTRAVVNEVLDVVITSPKVTPRGKDKNFRGIFAARRTKVERLVVNDKGILEKQSFPQIEVYGNFKMSDLFLVPGVDASKTHCDDIYEMQAALGNGAAKMFLHKEIFAVVTGSGSNVNPRYVTQLVDYMAWSGTIKPITRHGMQNFGPLQAAAFEMPVKVLANAALSNKSDPMLSPTANVIFGQEIRGIGTAIADAIPIDRPAPTVSVHKLTDWFDDWTLACPIVLSSDATMATTTTTTSDDYDFEMAVPLAF
jgi:DNA-directed RNA polymerase beta' subunit